MDAQIWAVLEQVNTLLYYLSEEAEAFLNSSNPSADDKIQHKHSEVDEFFKVHINVIFKQV